MSVTSKTVSAGKTASARSIDRRAFLKSTAATAAIFAAAKAALPGGAFAQGAGPEIKGTKLGYIALTDASPLIIAKEKGMFAKHGLPDMDIAKQASWARPATTWPSVPRPTALMELIS